MIQAAAVLLLALLAVPAALHAEITLPPGFTTKLYATGEGFEGGGSDHGRGLPSASTLGMDASGVLYLARNGRRYFGGEVEDVFPVFRIPLGGGRVSRAAERQYLYGPPLPNPQIAALRKDTELFVTTFDRERQVGVLYRMIDGRAELFAGGTPPKGERPVLRQPEGAAADRAGNVYVADRGHDAVLKLDPRGKVLDPRWLPVPRPRLVAIGADDAVWVAGDGAGEAGSQRGPGELRRVPVGGEPALLLHGPVAAGMALSPAGHLFVADRQNAKILVVTAGGQSGEFATFTDGDAPRALAFVPVTPATQSAGIAGDLLVTTIIRGAWRLNDVIRISGRFDDLVRERLGAPR